MTDSYSPDWSTEFWSISWSQLSYSWVYQTDPLTHFWPFKVQDFWSTYILKSWTYKRELRESTDSELCGSYEIFNLLWKCFFEMSLSRLFVHREWISTPASRVTAEVCWKSQNLSRGNTKLSPWQDGISGHYICFESAIWVCWFACWQADHMSPVRSCYWNHWRAASPFFSLTLALRQCDTSIHFCWTAATLLFLLLDALFFLIGGLCAAGDINHSGRRRHLIVVTSGGRRNECK